MKMLMIAALAASMVQAEPKLAAEPTTVQMTRAQFIAMTENLKKTGRHEFKKENVVLVIVKDSAEPLPFWPTSSRQQPKLEDLRRFEPGPYDGQSLSFRPRKKEDPAQA